MGRFVTAFALVALLAGAARADAIDDLVNAEMARRKIPGLALAIIDGGKIVKEQGYGVVATGGSPVTTETRFQAGSISKPVAAVGALKLVERGKLSLDADVNARLTSWKVPASKLGGKVTLRRLLSHTAGLTVHGFPGYEAGTPLPTVIQVLDGEKPANTEAVRVDLAPGSKWRYSGGGFTVMQLLVTEVTKQPFDVYMRDAVLAPLGMTRSSYTQPPADETARATATGHLSRRQPVPGRWHVYPEMAAAGLWTTAGDLARFAIDVQDTLAGRSHKVLSRAMARQYVTVQKAPSGLGILVEGKGEEVRFSHGGRDEGFDAMLVATPGGKGAVIMINANDNSGMMNRLVDGIASRYGWPGVTPVTAGYRIIMDPKVLERYEGRYELSNNNMRTLKVDDGRLFVFSDGFPDEELVPVAANRFRAGKLEIVFDGGPGFSWTRGKEKGKAPRVGPLAAGLATRADPEPETTRKALAVLAAVAAGKAKDEPALTPGAQRDFSTPFPDAAGVKALTLLAIEDVRGRGIERHEGKVARVLTYVAEPPGGRARFVLVHVTADGMVTDFDLVDD